MKRIVAFLLLFCLTIPTLTTAKSETIEYRLGDTKLVGYLAYPTEGDGPQPGVLIVHEWWGLNDYARKRADMLAEEGYVAFALDMYGEGKQTEHAETAAEWSAQVRQNLEVMQERFMAAYNLLRDHPTTDPEMIAAIGYCFGGFVVLYMGMHGADLDAVVSFHGALPTDPVEPGTVHARVLVCHGGSDPLTTVEQIEAFQAVLTQAGADWETNIYGGAKHSFTNPKADERGAAALGYDPLADKRSWEAMRDFLQEAFSVQ